MGDTPDIAASKENAPDSSKSEGVLVPTPPASAGGSASGSGSSSLSPSEIEAAARAVSADPSLPASVAEGHPSDSLVGEDDEVVDEHLVPKHFTAPAQISLDRVSDDTTFLLRDPAELEDVSALAIDLARLGQLFPIDVLLRPPDRFQIISGFRRVAALRMLQRDKVLARLHTDLSDEDATLMSLASAIHGQPVSREQLESVRERLRGEGRLTAASRDMIQKALETESGLGPESVEEEVDADELASDVSVRLGQCNQDLSLLADVFEELDEGRREELLTQLRYSAQLVAFLEGRK